ncbi:hypothetical protein HHI36_014717 [Cryptolaemus montrouzieri]|uniref:Transcriptional regulator ATRX n=1 Tax=Cryptolaemus montrouzieri TaxID=559131 RepID=A0ABD2N3T0_9CUCU
MTSDNLVDYLGSFLEKINYLTEVSHKKCRLLRNNLCPENGAAQCRDILEFCCTVRKNLKVFEEELIKEASIFNIMLENSESNTFDYTKNTVQRKKVLEDDLIISLKLGCFSKEEKIEHVTVEDIHAFCLDLKKFAENYGKETEYRNEPTSELSFEDPLTKDLLKILGDDSDQEAPCTSEQKDNEQKDNEQKDNELNDCITKILQKEKATDKSEITANFEDSEATQETEVIDPSSLLCTTVPCLSEPEKGVEVCAEVEEFHEETDSQSTQLDDSEVSNPEKFFKIDKGVDDSKKNDFLSSIGLTRTNNYDESQNVRQQLLGVLVEKSCWEVDNGEFAEVDRYSNMDVEKALRYLNESDSISDVESITSLGSDILLSSDIDENFTSASNQNSNVRNSPQKENVMQQSTSKQIEKENKKNRLESHKSVENLVSTGNITELEYTIIKNQSHDGIIKKCYIKIERFDLEKLLWLREERRKFVPKDCFVKLETLRLTRVSSDSETSSPSSTDCDSEIDRLCDLSNIEKERRYSTDSFSEEKRKCSRPIKRKRRNINCSGSETPDLSGYCTVSENELKKQRIGGIFDDEPNVKQEIYTALDPNELLTEIVCHTIHDSDSNSSSESGSNDEDDNVKKKSNLFPRRSNKEKESENEDKEYWRNDPLLKGSLGLPTDKRRTERPKKRKIRCSSDDNSDIDKKSEKKKRIHRRLDPTWESDNNSSSSSSGDEFETSFRRKRQANEMEDHDSDIEVVDNTDFPKPKKIDVDDELEKKPGRRNILSVLSNESLTQETQMATKEEEERVMRLEKRKQSRIVSEINTDDSLILDKASDGYQVTVDPVLSKRLYKHQVEGVKFMWDACYESVDTLMKNPGTGCILAHSMGLGKTFQVATLVHTLFRHSITNTDHVLVVCPLSTVSGWKKEFHECLKLAANKPLINIITIESSDGFDAKFGRIYRWKNKGGVLILGYEAFEKLTNIKRNNPSRVLYIRKALVNPGPDLIICDEGHLLKNGKTLRTKALMEIRTKRRIVLTGTPLQNNLKEYYHMVQFVKPNLLGTPHEFSRQFANPIMNGQYEDSLEADITVMKKRTHVLHRLLRQTVQRYEATELNKYLKNIKDYALFIQLHPVQELLYRSFIEMAKNRKIAKKKLNTFFSDYQISKYICSHPQLLYTMETQNARRKKTIKETDVISEEPEVQEIEGIPMGWWKNMCSDDVKTNIEFGTKLQVMMAIIEEAEIIGEKVLIFTSSLVELSSIEYFLKLKGTPSCPSWKPRRDYFRMDGTVAPSIRTKMCEIFNDKNNKTLRLFLMSHKVGGLGLNLVAANRVILLGANFNPSHDSQSVYRAYRFGQEKSVYIYRLLSMGTMEEKIYHRCVTKLAVASRVVDKYQIARHYKNLDLEDLYTVTVDLSLERSIPSKPDDDVLSNILLKFKCIHKYHQHQKLLENRPDEDLNEEDKRKAWEEFKSMGNATEKFNNSNTSRETELLNTVVSHVNLADPTDNIIPPTPAPVVPRKQFKAFHTTKKDFSNGRLPNPFVSNNASTFNNTSINQGLDKDLSNPFSQVNLANNHNPVINSLIDSHIGSNEILQNVSNNQLNSKKKTGKDKKKTTSIGPNPLVLSRSGKINNKKENFSTPGGSKPWRKSSSDDFQKPVKITKFPHHIAPTQKGYRISQMSKSSTSKPNNVHSQQTDSLPGNPNNSLASTAHLVSNDTNTETFLIDDDDDIIIIDTPEKRSSRLGLSVNDQRNRSIQETIESLNRNQVKVNTVPRKQTEKPIDDSLVIEIL